MSKLSVIVPCYNVESYIAQCLESIVQQKFADIEIICINDGSDDNTLKQLTHFQSIDSRIVIIDQPNEGISSARNAGIFKASGKFLMFVDADDWLADDALPILIPAAENCDLLVFSYWRELETASLRKKFGIQGDFDPLDFQRKIIGQLGKELRNLSSFDALAPVWGKIYRTGLIKENVRFVSLQDIGTWEDGLFNVQYLEHCRRHVRVIDEPYYHYRKTNLASYTSEYRPGLFEKWKYKFSLIEKLIQTKDSQFTEALHNRIAITFFNLTLVESRSPVPFTARLQQIKRVMYDPLYATSLKNLNLRNVPPGWRPFFFLVKRRWATPLLLSVLMVDRLLSLRNGL